MKIPNLHRLLKRQIAKAGFEPIELDRLDAFLLSVNKAYNDYTNDINHLENILEVSSQELFKSNQFLKNDVAVKSEEADLVRMQLKRVLNNVHEIIFQVDLNGNYTFINSAWEDLTGIKVEDTIGQNFLDFLTFVSEDQKPFLTQIREMEFEELRKVFNIQMPNQEQQWLDLTLKLTRDKQGEKDGAIGSIVNITSQKKIEGALIKASDAKNEFLSTMSHEIRTPLNAVIGISNILLMNDPLPEQLENLNGLKFSANHLLGLINDILDFNKIEAGMIEFETVEFSLFHLLNGIDKTLGFIAREKGLSFKIKRDHDTPDVVKGDSVRLNQILSNLVNNAIKFTQEGEIVLDVEVEEANEEETIIKFKVADTGIGIKEEKLKMIFESFTQAESFTTKKYGGTGLGLAISKSLLELQGSQLQVSSEYGKGTNFYFSLKFYKSERFEIDSSATFIKTQPSFSSLDGLRVLMAEDNHMNVMVIKQFFVKWKVDLTIALNGEEAISKLEQNDFDLILMDLQMPIMDGYTATKKIRSLEDKMKSIIPIIALTASASSDVVNQTKSVGMDSYLSKPFDPVDLYQILKSHHKKET